MTAQSKATKAKMLHWLQQSAQMVRDSDCQWNERTEEWDLPAHARKELELIQAIKTLVEAHGN